MSNSSNPNSNKDNKPKHNAKAHLLNSATLFFDTKSFVAKRVHSAHAVKMFAWLNEEFLEFSNVLIEGVVRDDRHDEPPLKTYDPITGVRRGRTSVVNLYHVHCAFQEAFDVLRTLGFTLNAGIPVFDYIRPRHYAKVRQALLLIFYLARQVVHLRSNTQSVPLWVLHLVQDHMEKVLCKVKGYSEAAELLKHFDSLGEHTDLSDDEIYFLRAFHKHVNRSTDEAGYPKTIVPMTLQIKGVFRRLMVYTHYMLTHMMPLVTDKEHTDTLLMHYRHIYSTIVRNAVGRPEVYCDVTEFHVFGHLQHIDGDTPGNPSYASFWDEDPHITPAYPDWSPDLGANNNN